MKAIIIHKPALLMFTLLASLASLAIAFIAQYGFGLKPCHLCLLQRVPYTLIIVAALIGLRLPQRQVAILALIGALFLADSGIAAYHVMVEKQLISGPTGCTSQASGKGESLDDFMKRIENAPIVSCDQPQWEFHGVSMAGLNAAWALFLAVSTFMSLGLMRRRSQHA